MLKKIFLGLLAIFVIAQFIRPEKNLSDDRTYAITTAYDVPQDVAQIMKVACNDCHSNRTRYPWYANIQPAAWWLEDHVREGKGELNFSEFTNKAIAVQNHKLEEVIEKIEEGEMPLPEYTYLGLHPEANLSDTQKNKLIEWARAQMAMLAESYPPDSLVRRKRPRLPQQE